MTLQKPAPHRILGLVFVAAFTILVAWLAHGWQENRRQFKEQTAAIKVWHTEDIRLVGELETAMQALLKARTENLSQAEINARFVACENASNNLKKHMTHSAWSAWNASMLTDDKSGPPEIK